jgi:hypothetical protein
MSDNGHEGSARLTLRLTYGAFLILVNILEPRHSYKILFFGIIEATGVIEVLGILVGPEHHVPPHDVAVIVQVTFVLVMDSVHFGTLEKVTNPSGGSDIRVIEKLTRCGAERINRTSLQTQSEQTVDQQAANDRVDEHLQRMLVERSDNFDSLRAVMDLMKHQP